MSPDVVLVDRRGPALVVTINRPGAMNAVNGDVATAIGDALQSAEADATVRAVVLTGAGERAFCAGADLKALARGEPTAHREHPEWGFAGYVRHFVSVPTIAAVNGFALGGGTELCLASDLVVAAETAQFGLPEVRRGIIAAAGGAFRLPRAIPRKIAMEMIFTGRPIDARQAHAWGLVNRIAAAESVLTDALSLAGEIAANAPLAVRASKRIAYGAAAGDAIGETSLWGINAAEWAVVRKSQDAREGAQAFADKRQPVWLSR
jgi:crotonobetainyl-CoA hydratase